MLDNILEVHTLRKSIIKVSSNVFHMHVDSPMEGELLILMDLLCLSPNQTVKQLFSLQQHSSRSCKMYSI